MNCKIEASIIDPDTSPPAFTYSLVSISCKAELAGCVSDTRVSRLRSPAVTLFPHKIKLMTRVIPFLLSLLTNYVYPRNSICAFDLIWNNKKKKTIGKFKA